MNRQNFSIVRLGAGGKGYKELAQQIELSTGGLNVSTHLTADHSDLDCFEQVTGI